MTVPAAFAIPGDIETLTGGFIYERRLLEGLRAAGHGVQHIRLAETFPAPSDEDMAAAIAALEDVEPTRPLIVDGLVFGAIDTAGLSRVRAPIVAMIHHPLALESGLDEASRIHLFRTERDNLTLAAHVFVPSPHTRRVLVEQYDAKSERITVIRPGVEPPSGPPRPAEPPLILSVGILHPRKGHNVLIDALDRIRQLEWRAVIVGNAWDPDFAVALERQIDQLDLGGRVRLAGKVPAEELQDLYQTAAIFALATRYEGYGIVFDEALSHGLPIVSCRTGAVPDTVPSSSGMLVPADDPDAFAAALARLLQDRDLRATLAEAALRAGADAPSWADQARLAGAVLDTLAAERLG
ncbi:glycosyltransferase family 4 protein [Tropicimonas isoalkanivorans]|uniref:Glycosyltransferase involved in cell wall bisynthesis n=1 Tax=Tropicimonas isoalkanivorans TaxID=441112 RepID=A0A1I1LJ18_9RHOB|nr:glycosyltransferase family 4 protein [Tropicimonas isoalkanivorans]SFC73197.1 Glycosyltransferase involved in cell wall bisynthesis [Tropicimonas isoalkanivorans]